MAVSTLPETDPRRAYSPSNQFDAYAARSDTVNFTNIAEMLFVGVAGNVSVVDVNNVAVTWAVPAGQYIYCRAKRVNSTLTTATQIIGLY